jgi:hypothetical protein
LDTTLLISVLLCIVAIVALFAYLLRELFARKTVTTFDPMWLEEFSVAKYRPMTRLLAEEDYAFLAGQSGFDAKISATLRAERRRIFRAYLRSLVRDFNRLHFCAKLMASHSSEDRSEVLTTLVKQRITFSFALAAVECRLVMHTFGFGPVEVRKLISTLDQSRSLLVASPGRA